MLHKFKQGDRALFVYEEEFMEGIVQETHHSIQWNKLSIKAGSRSVAIYTV